MASPDLVFSVPAGPLPKELAEVFAIKVESETGDPVMATLRWCGDQRVIIQLVSTGGWWEAHPDEHILAGAAGFDVALSGAGRVRVRGWDEQSWSVEVEVIGPSPSEPAP